MQIEHIFLQQILSMNFRNVIFQHIKWYTYTITRCNASVLHSTFKHNQNYLKIILQYLFVWIFKVAISKIFFRQIPVFILNFPPLSHAIYTTRPLQPHPFDYFHSTKKRT
jgi:hypothetical protein